MAIYTEQGLQNYQKQMLNEAFVTKKTFKEEYKPISISVLTLEAGDTEIISLNEAIDNNQLFEYCISSVYGNNLSFDERYQFRKEWDRCVIREEENPTQSQQSTPKWKDPTEVLKQNQANGISFEQVQQVYQNLAKQLQEKQDEQNRSTAEKKGTFATVIYQIKQAMAWVKNQMLKFKDNVMDTFSNKEKGYHSFVRNVNRVNTLSGAKPPNQTQPKPTSGVTNSNNQQTQVTGQQPTAAQKAAESMRNTLQQHRDGTVHQGA